MTEKPIFSNKTAATATESDEQTESKKKSTIFDKRIFRLATALLYLGGISGLGFILAIYFLFFWDSNMPAVPIVKSSILQSRS